MKFTALDLYLFFKGVHRMNKSSIQNDYIRGLKDGMPVALGYLPVSMASGIVVSKVGIGPLISQLMAVLIYSSSGQAAAAQLFEGGETSILMYMLTLFVINCRYMLFAISLSQRFDPSMKLREKAFAGWLNTDEIFGVVIREKGYISGKYFFGVATLPYISFFIGNLLGSFTTEILPKDISSVVNFMIFAMFVSIIVPSAKKSRPIFAVVLIALAISVVLECIPVVTKHLTPGWIIIICALVTSLIGAALFPIPEEKEEEEV